jgi:hypothetical protein
MLSVSRRSAHSDPALTSTDLPDFFVLGAAKSGTTSLHHYLRQHSALHLPEVKELDFFNAPKENFESGLEWYLEYFRGADGRVSGEATPLYFRGPDLVPSRMRRVYGTSSPQFLLILRDPVRRAYSHYLHKVSQGTEPLSFEEALEAEDARPEQKRREWKSYFQDGLYAQTLSRWLEFFPRERFFIMLSENLREHPHHVLYSVFQFLGVDPREPIDTSARLNRTDEQASRILGIVLSVLPSWLPPLARRWTPETLRLWIEQIVRRSARGGDRSRSSLNPKLERQLRRRYAPHVRHLEELIDRDLSAWLPEETD